MNSIAVRVPWAKVAGAVASQCASLAKRPEVIFAIRRSKSSGSSASSSTITIATAASAAGTIVTLTGSSPGSTPVRNKTPKTTKASR